MNRPAGTGTEEGGPAASRMRLERRVGRKEVVGSAPGGARPSAGNAVAAVTGCADAAAAAAGRGRTCCLPGARSSWSSPECRSRKRNDGDRAENTADQKRVAEREGEGPTGRRLKRAKGARRVRGSRWMGVSAPWAHRGEVETGVGRTSRDDNR